MDVEFDVSVEAVTADQAAEYANGNTDISKNFMSLDGTGTSHVNGNSGEFNIDQLNQRGSSTAAHEYGHMLGYRIDKGKADQARYDDGDHAWRIPEEKYYIMSRAHGMGAEGLSKRRVDPIEYTRLNGGIERREKESKGGLFTPTNTTKVQIVNPDKPLTNKIYK